MLLSCSSYNEKAVPNAEATTFEQSKSALEENNAKEDKKTESTVDVKNYAERKLIKEGSISYETDNVNNTKTLIEKEAKDMNGYISKEYSSDVDNRFEYTLEVRIPSDKFDSFVSAISSSIVRLNDKNIQVQDVTEEYVDVEARLKAKKEVMDRYTELLKQAKNVTEMMDVEKEIGNLQTDIESMEGRLKYLNNRISLSTLTVTFYGHTERGFAFGSKIMKGLLSGWKGFLWLVIGFVYLWPLWLILLIGLWTLIHFLKRKSKK